MSRHCQTLDGVIEPRIERTSRKVSAAAYPFNNRRAICASLVAINISMLASSCALAQTTRTSPSAASTSQTLPLSSSTSATNPCSSNQTSPCSSAKTPSIRCYSAVSPDEPCSSAETPQLAALAAAVTFGRHRASKHRTSIYRGSG